jgi:hypothetical protein
LLFRCGLVKLFASRDGIIIPMKHDDALHQYNMATQQEKGPWGEVADGGWLGNDLFYVCFAGLSDPQRRRCTYARAGGSLLTLNHCACRLASVRTFKNSVINIIRLSKLQCIYIYMEYWFCQGSVMYPAWALTIRYCGIANAWSYILVCR